MVGPATNLLHCRRNAVLAVCVHGAGLSPIHFRFARPIGHYGICCNYRQISVQQDGRDNSTMGASSK